MTKQLSFFLALLAPVGSAWGGVTISQIAKSGGFKGYGAHEVSSTRRIQGSKSRDESDFKFTGAVLGALAGKAKNSVEILRVDLDKRWVLDAKKKRYQESSLSTPPEEPSEAEQDGGKGEKSEPTHRVKSTKFEVDKTGKKKEINGFATEGYTVAFVIEVEDLKTKETAVYKMASEQWLSPWTKELKAARKEEQAFTQAYLKKLGWELSPSEQKNMGLTMIAMMTQAGSPELRKALNDFKKKSSKLEGYPIVTDTRWYVQSSGKGGKAARARDDDEDEEGVDLMHGASGLLAGFAKKAAKKKMKEKAREQAQGGEGKPALSLYTEVREVSVEEVAGQAFEIPEGYKKGN